TRMTRIAAPLLVLLTSLSLAPVAHAQTVAFGPPPGAKLSVEKLGNIADFINGAIVLVQQHGKPVYLKWFGLRDPDKGTPMTEDAIFPIHSVTKTITSVAAM